VIVDQALYVNGRRQPCEDLSDELTRLRNVGEPGDFVWIGLQDPTTAEFGEVNDELGLHPLAIEDAVTGRQRPKIDRYEGYLFIVLRPLRYIEETSDIETGEIMAFVGEHVVVTVRRGDVAPLESLRRRLEAHPAALQRGPFGVLHALIDEVVDGYTAIDEEIASDLDAIEAAVFGAERVGSGAIYRLGREVLEFRRAAAPLAHPLALLYQEDSPIENPELRLLLRGVSDHLRVVIDHIESYDRMLTDILSADLAQISVRQNDDMRRISAWVAIAALPTMVAGIYGMNFDTMPELRWRYGYFVILGLMATGCLGLYRAFKRSGWL
jgi:magnesium transporter